MIVVALPVRSAVCPTDATELDSSDLTYQQEVQVLRTLCSTGDIKLIDCEQACEQLTKAERERMFYAVHYSPHGHEVVAGQLVHRLNL